MHLRRLVFAFLLAMVAGFATTSVSRAESFPVGHLGVQAPSSSVVLSTYDASPNFLSETSTLGMASISDSGSQTTEIGVEWENTHSVAGLAAADTAASTGDTYVIGKLADTAQYIDKPGYNVLNLPDDEWTPTANANWVQSGVDQGAPFLTASEPNASTVFDVSRGTFSVYGQELLQLDNSGYAVRGAQQGDILLPGTDQLADGQ